MPLFDASTPFGKFGNDIFDNTKVGQGYNLINNIANQFQDASIDKSIQDLGNQFGGTEVKYLNGIFNDDTNTSKALADNAKNPFTSLIAPISDNIDQSGFRPSPGSGIWKVLSLV